MDNTINSNAFTNFNTTEQTGTRIYSTGPNIGGNYWTTPNGGYSDTCTDSDNDGFCDSAFNPKSFSSCTSCPENRTDYLPYSDEYSTGVADITYSINQNTGASVIRFLNCSPDWEYYPSQPEGQTSTEGILNATNNETVSGDFQIEYVNSLNSGWTLYSCNSSSSDPKNSADCNSLSTNLQTIYTDVTAGESKDVWLYANCSYITANPGADINMEAN